MTRSGFGIPGVVRGAVAALALLAVAVAAQTRPARIISLIPAVTEMLFAIGAGDQVVGVSSFDTFPPEVGSRMKVGGLFDPSFERILGLRPDLVVVYGSQDDLVARLSQARIPMFSYRHAGLADITATIRELGERTGRAAQARTLADDIERELAAVRRASEGRQRPKTLLVFGREEGALRGIYVSGGTGFLHDLVLAAGGDNVMADVPREGLQISLEHLLTRAPEVVIELRGSESWSPERRAREAAVWHTAPVPAARAGRIYLLVDPSLTIPGPRVAASARALAQALR